MYVSDKLVIKNSVAATAVLRLRKFAEPLEPNRLPAEPVPNAAPMSAPLPCCINTRPINTTAVKTCTTQTNVSTHYSTITIQIRYTELKVTSKLDRDEKLYDETTSHSTRLSKDNSQVAGYVRAPARQIAKNSSATSEAPPIKPPSISGIANNSAALFAFTLPP